MKKPLNIRKSPVSAGTAPRAARQAAGAKKRRSLSQKQKYVLRQLGKYCLMLWVLSLLWIISYRFVDAPATLLMLQRKNERLVEKGKWDAVKYSPVTIEEVSKEVPLAMLAAEDQNFLNHSGFDFEAMRKAFYHNQRGRKIRGGSTISQQVAKNVFLWNGRSYFRKGLEVYFTAAIELLWGKERILEHYLNVAETGDHIFGVEAAAKWAFRKPAADLSRSEAATIAAVLPSPRKRSVKNPDSYTSRRRNRIVKHMRRLGGTTLVSHFY